MTPDDALRALVTARAALPNATNLRDAGIVATAFSATSPDHGLDLQPELLVFHSEPDVFAPDVSSAISAAGVHARYFQTAMNTVAGPTAAQKKFAQEVVTRTDVLMAGARLLLHPVSDLRKGTLGCLARRGGVPGLITCAHVVADAAGGRLRWPRVSEIVAENADVVVEVPLSTLYGPLFTDSSAMLDAAFVPFTSSSVPLSSQVHGMGPSGPVKDISMPDLTLIGRHAFAPGAATGQRRGRIAGLLVQEYGTDLQATVDFLIVSDDDAGLPMSGDGDSGSIWYFEDTREPFALHFRKELFSIPTKRHVVALASNLSQALTQLGATT